MTKINVVNLDLPAPAPVAVNPPHECLCEFLLMSPARAINHDVEFPFRVCECCGGLIDEDAMTAYNEYYGYSGFDECYEEDCAAV